MPYNDLVTAVDWYLYLSKHPNVAKDVINGKHLPEKPSDFKGLEMRIMPLLDSFNRDNISDNVVVDQEDGFFCVYTGLIADIYTNVLHTTYADSTLEELDYIWNERIHEKGFKALEHLKNTNPDKYRIQKKHLEDNLTQLNKVYDRLVKDVVLVV